MTPNARRRPGRGAAPTTSSSRRTTTGPEGSRALTLFDEPPARAGDPDTSHAAGASHGEHRARIRRDVLAVHQRHPDGLTDDQLAQHLPDDHPPSLVKRRGELVRDGALIDSGRRQLTRRGSAAIVWVLTSDAGGSGVAPCTPEPLRPESAAWAREQWCELTDDQVVAELVTVLEAPRGAFDGYVLGRDGKRYPASTEHPFVLLAQLLTAYLLSRGIGLRDLARRVNRSHATVRRWAEAGRDLTIAGPKDEHPT
jgi:hypothetical protein